MLGLSGLGFCGFLPHATHKVPLHIDGRCLTGIACLHCLLLLLVSKYSRLFKHVMEFCEGCDHPSYMQLRIKGSR